MDLLSNNRSPFTQEEQFASEFFDRDGLNELVDIINSTHGNTLAVSRRSHLYIPAYISSLRSQYALTAMQNLMELDHGWATLSPQFILRIVQILSSETSLINVCRPATAILKKLVEADSTNGTGNGPSSSRAPPTPLPDSVYRYGFEVVWEQMCKEPLMLETVVSRLGSADTTMALYRCVCIPQCCAVQLMIRGTA